MSLPATPSPEGNLTLLELVSTQVGRLSVNLYPWKAGQRPEERAHAFHVNMNALTLLPIETRLILDALGRSLNCSAVAEGLMFDWKNHFDSNWFNFANLAILSFHGSDGRVIANTTIVGDPTILLPVQNGAVGDCRKGDVRFVRVACTIDFSTLITIPGYGTSTLRVSFYIELPQTTVITQDHRGADYNLTTWHGAAHLATLTPAQVRTQILEPCLHTGPITLGAASFNLTDAQIDDTTYVDIIHSKVLKLGFKQICKSIFQQLCPGYSDQPHAALEHIRMTSVGPDGQAVTSTTIEYYQRMLNASRPFASQATYAVSVCDKFIQGLDPRLLGPFRRFYPQHSMVHDLNGSYQRSQLVVILAAAQAAEDEVKQMQDIARGMLGQGFFSTIIGGDSVPAFPSQAEKTLTRYSSGGNQRERLPLKCFGCGGDHVWIKGKKIMCPKAKEPGVAKNAAAQYEAYRRRIAEARATRGGKRRRQFVNFNDMSETDQKRMREQVLTSSATSSQSSTTSAITTSTSGSNPHTVCGPTVFMISVPVPVLQSPARRTLPVQIQAAFPHITLQLGSALGCSSCPAIRCVIDTAAALSTGNLHFFAAIAKAYPHTVAAVHRETDYSPITLSGIVQQGGESVSTELTVAFQFHLPYLTREGHPTHLSVACGPNVTVNTILGLPFIQQTRMIIDASDQVAELRALDTPPFTIDFRRAMCTVPDIGHPPTPAVPSARFTDIINQVDEILAFYAADPQPNPQGILLPSRRSRAKLTFGKSFPVAARTRSKVEFDDERIPAIAFGDDASFVSIGSSIKPKPSSDIDITCPFDMHTSARVPSVPPDPFPPPTFTAAIKSSEPIRVAPRMRGQKRRNVFYDDRGFPDQSHDFDVILRNVDGGSILRRRKHPAPSLDDIDPAFLATYDESIHGAKLRRELDLSHLSAPVRDSVYRLIQKYWNVFDDKGQFVPVKDYSCIIDTGSAKPIAVKKIHYGPREIPIMRQCIANLAKLNYISQIHDGEWLFKALLAPKPHQEHITSIDKFVWRFCINYIPLNQVTRPVAYPIPRCDSAVHLTFGDGRYMWLWDAPSGYHQIGVSPCSRPKLAFAGPDATKWTYNVMPFGPVNGPPTFIAFIHDLDSTWKDLARSLGVTIDNDTNTNIIVDDILSYAKSLLTALLYMECQLRVAQSQNLSLSLKKSHIFPTRFEFVGIDVCPEGNRPAMSKHQLLQHWDAPVIVRDVAKFVGFIQFYSRFIPNFEVRISPLRDIMIKDYTEPIGDMWTPAASAAFDEMKKAILDDPCLRRFDHRKLLVLRTDFSADGFGYVALQPADDEPSISAMHKCMRGEGFDFMTKTSTSTLHPVAFGCRRTRGNEKRLHSHLGEGFSGDWSINKCRHMCFGQRFTWVTDCYAIKFILSYDGKNPAILRLQMRFMCWDMDIEHRNDVFLTDADYWSRLGADLCFDPLLKEYIQQISAIRNRAPSPTAMPPAPENMPYFRGPRLPPSSDNTTPVATISASELPFVTRTEDVQPSIGLQHLSNYPVRFGLSPQPSSAHSSSAPLYHSEVTCAASILSHFDWAVYGFNSGHFISNIQKHGLPFRITLGCDPFASGRALFKDVCECPTILSSAPALLDHVRGSGITAPLAGYLIHSHRYSGTDPASKFWEVQANIVLQLRLIRNLSIVVAWVHPDHDGRSFSTFLTKLKASGWIATDSLLRFRAFNDTITGTHRLVMAIHSNTEEGCKPLELRIPPSGQARQISSFIWEPFNRPELAISYARSDASFNIHAVNDNGLPPMTATCVTTAQQSSMEHGIRPLYFLHRKDDNPNNLAGALVVHSDSWPPAFSPVATPNVFGHYFGIEFIHGDNTYVRAISPFEFASMFRLTDELTYKLSQPCNAFCFDAGIPALTSASVFSAVLDRLTTIRSRNFDIFQPHQVVAPAACVQAFLNGAVGVRLPRPDEWSKAYEDDRETSAILKFVANPGTITNRNLEDAKLHASYRAGLRQSHFAQEDVFLVYREPIAGSDSYTRLIVVPSVLRNVVFVAFHSNPAGGHFNVVRTFHRIRLRFYWPNMYKYISSMCSSCPGCALTNLTHGKSRELVYSFPIEAPFMVLHIDGYQAGAESGFEGSSHYIITACGMCTFAAMEPIQNANATTYASAIMKIILRYGFCHTVVLDKDSKFFGVCREALDLLKINCHVLSGANHNPMIVERINRYLNQGLRIMCNERDTNRIALEGILLLIYAWNSCPVPGTDISRSMVAVGREFAFPIDFSLGKHAELFSAPGTVASYSKELATRLEACRDIAMLLVKEQRTWHRELINSRRRDPRIYHEGDIVFARRATRSDSRRGRVGKLMHPFTGPWRIVKSLDGASYELEFVGNPSRRDKKHASDLSHYPPELIPFQPLDTADSRYGQLYRPIGDNPYKEAGIKGFTPPQPFQIASHFLTKGDFRDFHFPTLAELNDELWPFPWVDDEERLRILSDDTFVEVHNLYTGPPPSMAIPGPPTPPILSSLIANIIASSDKLFFISHSLGNPTAREWRLVRVAFSDSTALSPSCLQDGRFLVDFYILHYSDVRYNAINQRYWLQYHSPSDIHTPTSLTTTHLIRPSDTSESHATHAKLVPFRRWINLTHTDTYLHGPFEFATVNGRKTRDRVAQADWDILSGFTLTSTFINPLPRFDLPSYSIHVDPGIHVSYQDPAHALALCALSQSDDERLYR